MTNSLKLTDIGNEPTVAKRRQFLEEYILQSSGSREFDPVSFLQFLQQEILETEYVEWIEHCKQVQQITQKQYKITSESFFDPSALVWELISDRQKEQKILLVEHNFEHIREHHTHILEWFESQLNSKDAQWRAWCRKKLDLLEKHFPLDEANAGVHGLKGKLDLHAFSDLSQKGKLKWLSFAYMDEDKSRSIRDWGFHALASENDRFVISNLVKTIPRVFVEHNYPAPQLHYILEGFLSHEDARVRANTLEGLFHYAKQESLADRILELTFRACHDADHRVKTQALELIHSLKPEKADEQIQSMLNSVMTAEELESIQWLLGATKLMDEHYEKKLDAILNQLKLGR